jgi:hypothetical protein
MVNAVTSNIIRAPESVGINRKEKHFIGQYTLLDKDREHLVIRIYRTRATTYACVWYNNRATCLSGLAGASAKGSGFDHEGAVIDSAFRKMRLQLSESVEKTSARTALEAIARADGLTDYVIHSAHP